MRDIKFRAWDGKKMHFPIEWGNSGVMYPNEYIHDNYPNEGDFPLLYNIGRGGVEMLQWTGLIDKNGVEIYEGDIVIADCRNHNENQLHYIIEYDNINTCFFGSTDKLKNNKYKIGLNEPMADIRQNIEVIGNIYENPELLEEEKK